MRSSLQKLGDADQVRDQLRGVIAGPQLASTLEFAETLSRLALHYWRPDFQEDEAAKLNADYLEDLRGITLEELQQACRAWRRNPENRFYPTSGQLRALVKDAMSEREKQKRGAETLLLILAEDKPETDRAAVGARQLHEMAEEMRTPAARRGTPAQPSGHAPSVETVQASRDPEALAKLRALRPQQQEA